MRNKILLLVIPLILTIGIIPAISFAEQIDSPKKQMDAGTAPEDVVCKSRLALMIRNSGSAACMQPDSIEKLENRGWNLLKEATIMEPTETMLSPEEAKSIIEEAYIFGYPLVLMDVTAKKFTNVPEAGALSAPINQFAHFLEFPTPDFKDVVKPNADTLYSTSFLDLSKEPIVLHVPDTDDRYYLMPMLDAWSNVFNVPGKRTTGTEANDYAITGPFWDGTLPEGVTEINAPTELVWILGRTQTNGVNDFEAVNAIQEQYTLTPLSSFGELYGPPKDVEVNSSWNMITPPADQVNQAESSFFFNRMAMLMIGNHAAAEDADMLTKFEKIGIIPGQEFDYSNFGPEIINAIESGVNSARQKIQANTQNLGTVENGWNKALGLGSYGTDYLTRATVAMFALGANLAKDAIYPFAYTDSSGGTLNGANKYLIHFSEGQTPPVNAFWSLTMYDMNEFFVENPINRYSIGDRNNLTYNEDGSLDIYIQHEVPEGHESNWLPAPDDDFNITMRMYWPQEDAFDGTWELPLIEKIAVE